MLEFLRSRVMRVMRSRPPDFIIGTTDNPYLLRWWAIPRNRWFNIYLHKFMRDDDDRALHDHPWLNCSIVLTAGYFEETPSGRLWRAPGTIRFRQAVARHRIELQRVNGVSIPAITIFITGPRIREWGFWCPKGFIPWQRFTRSDNPGEVGPGCDG